MGGGRDGNVTEAGNCAGIGFLRISPAIKNGVGVVVHRRGIDVGDCDSLELRRSKSGRIASANIENGRSHDEE